ncbi:hypothetical protein FACS189446_2010 [Bacteroidia bacterium]|nr:hypothetical protein FACS189446_2010 [Bacteroidia bacterium]
MQENNQFIPPSPTVAELGKYGMIPVSHYTGVPDISIPIYTIKCGSLTLPITLSYHAGGIRVEQIASWVGLGWSLNAGGIISVSIMGTSDFNSSYARNIKDWNDIHNGIFPTHNDLTYSVSTPYTKDLQPDIYSYNFNGHSGQFVLTNNGANFQAHEIKNNKQIKIIPHPNNNNTTFTIYDEQGTIYEFAYQEITTTRFSQASGYYPLSTSFSIGEGYDEKVCCTAWFLTSISSSDGTDYLSFTYENEVQEYNTRVEGSIYHTIQNNPVTGRNWTDAGVLNYQHINNSTKRLKKITGSNGLKIEFAADTLRKDLKNSKKLDKITIFYNNEQLKQWKLGYDYFTSSPLITSPTTNNTIPQSPDDTLQNRRLKLISVTEDSNKKWSFRYFGDDSGEKTMPFRTAFYGSDYWGYCNGPVTTASSARDFRKLFPIIEKDYNYGTQTTHVSSSWGSSKAPVLNFAKTYTLKSISYPTGGHSEFVYGLHDYSKVGASSQVGDSILCGGLRIQEIKNYWSDGELATKKTYRYKDIYDDKSSGSVINAIQTTAELDAHLYKVGNKDHYAIYDHENFQINNGYDVRVVELTSSPYTSLYSYGGDYIGYSYVRESDENGTTRYDFYSICDYPNDYKTIFLLFGSLGCDGWWERTAPKYPFRFGYWGASYGRGLLHKKHIYNSNNQEVYIEENLYDTLSVKRVYGWEVQGIPNFTSNPDGSGSILSGLNYERFYANCYFHQTGQALLKQTTTTQYDVNGANPVTTIHKYGYNELNQISHDTIMNSDSSVFRKELKYPSDFQTSPYPAMVTKNILSPIVETYNYKSNSLIEKTAQDYALQHNSFYAPVNSKYQKGYGNLEVRETYQYSTKGNVREVIKNGSDTTVYLWSYKSQYPIAEIKNAPYSQVEQILTSTLISRVDSTTTPATADLTAIKNLRTNTTLSGAMVTVYEYKPLIGVSKMTDPRGVVTEYVYDDFGRLKKIIQEGKAVEEYKYHYKN